MWYSSNITIDWSRWRKGEDKRSTTVICATCRHDSLRIINKRGWPGGKGKHEMKIRYNVMHPLVWFRVRYYLSFRFIFVWDGLAINHCKYYIARPTSVCQKLPALSSSRLSSNGDPLSCILDALFVRSFDYVTKKTCANENSYKSSRGTRDNFSL